MVGTLLSATAPQKSVEQVAEKANSAKPAESNVAKKRRGKKRRAKVSVPEKENLAKPAASNIVTRASARKSEAKVSDPNATSTAISLENATVPVSKTIKKIDTGRKRPSRRRRRALRAAQSNRSEVSTPQSGAIFEGIEESIVSGAVQALMKDFKDKHHDANDNTTPAGAVRLIDDDTKVSLVFNLKVPPSNPRFKPKRIELKHSLHKEQSDICMFVKDPAELVTVLLDKLGYGGVTRVMGIAELKTDFNTHERRRTLGSTYDSFLCDARVIPSMPKLLGNFFSKSKKTPLEVDLDRKLPDVIERAVKSTSLHMPTGTCTTVHIGRTRFTTEQLVENVMKAIPRIVATVENGIDNIQSVHIKTTRSKSLPLYVSLPTAVNIAPKKKEKPERFSLEDTPEEKKAEDAMKD